MSNYYEEREGVHVAMQFGFNNAGQNITSDIDGTRVAIRTDFIVPAGSTMESIVSHIVSGVLQHFPGITKKEVVSGMMGTIQKIIWNDKHTLSNDMAGISWMRSACMQLERTVNNTKGNYIMDVHGEKRSRRIIKQQQEEQTKKEMLATEEEILREKFKYLQDINEMTFDGLKELDKYVGEKRKELIL